MADILQQIQIAAAPAKVFEAITTAAGFRHWWTADCEAEPQPGSVAIFRFAGGQVVFRMRIDELEPDRRVTWTCLGDWPEWEGTRVEWILKPDDRGGTELHFAHRNWKTTAGDYPVCNTTWGHLMHLLKDHAEGKPVRPHFTG